MYENDIERTGVPGTRLETANAHPRRMDMGSGGGVKRYYVDNCATTPMAPEVAAAMIDVMRDVPGNPGSIHFEGQQAARVVANARSKLADSVGGRPAEIVFTGSGTEANNVAIGGLIGRAVRVNGRARAITSAVEHASVATRLAWEKRLHGDALEVITVGVDSHGALRLDELDQALEKPADLVALLLVNNETGVVQDIDSLKARKLRSPSVPWLLDAVQAQGKLALDMRLLPFDLLSFSAHKIYGPKGAGALYMRGGVELDPLVVGGGQEKFRRAGTENVAGIAGFAKAVELMPDPAETARHLQGLERTLLLGLIERNVEFTINGPDEAGTQRLPGFINLSFAGVASREDLQIALDLEGVSLSSTSACHSGVAAESHVLEAMGIKGERKSGAIRLLLSRYHCMTDAAEIAGRIARVVKRIAGAAA